MTVAIKGLPVGVVTMGKHIVSTLTMGPAPAPVGPPPFSVG